LSRCESASRVASSDGIITHSLHAWNSRDDRRARDEVTGLSSLSEDDASSDTFARIKGGVSGFRLTRLLRPRRVEIGPTLGGSELGVSLLSLLRSDSMTLYFLSSFDCSLLMLLVYSSTDYI
jgi:hypothetical protein